MAQRIQHVESVVINSLRRFRERYFPAKEDLVPVKDPGEEEPQLGFLDSLPVRKVLIIHGRRVYLFCLVTFLKAYFLGMTNVGATTGFLLKTLCFCSVKKGSAVSCF